MRGYEFASRVLGLAVSNCVAAGLVRHNHIVALSLAWSVSNRQATYTI